MKLIWVSSEGFNSLSAVSLVVCVWLSLILTVKRGFKREKTLQLIPIDLFSVTLNVYYWGQHSPKLLFYFTDINKDLHTVDAGKSENIIFLKNSEQFNSWTLISKQFVTITTAVYGIRRYHFPFPAALRICVKKRHDYDCLLSGLSSDDISWQLLQKTSEFQRALNCIMYMRYYVNRQSS